MNRIIITAAIATALIFSSCSTDVDDPPSKKKSSSSGMSSSSGRSSGGGNSSSDDGSSSSRGGSNSSGADKTYELADHDDESFTYLEEEREYSCEENGNLNFTIETSDNTVYYSIEDQIMTWGNDYNLLEGDTIQLKGSSDELKGTWTRTKSKDNSCTLKSDDDYSFSWFECKNYYDITKAVITSSSVTITREVCDTDEAVNDSEINGWKIKVVDCNTVEYSKGSYKVTEKSTETSEEVRYNSQTCKLSYAETDKRAACKEAWDIYQEEGADDISYLDYYYRTSIYRKEDAFDDCLKSKLPPEFLEDFFDISGGGGDDCEGEDDPDCEDGGDDSGPAGKIATKSVAKDKAKIKAKVKTKITPLWKKKK